MDAPFACSAAAAAAVCSAPAADTALPLPPSMDLVARLAPFVEHQFRLLAEIPLPGDAQPWQERWTATRSSIEGTNTLIELLESLIREPPREGQDRLVQLESLRKQWAANQPPVMLTLTRIERLFHPLSVLVELQGAVERFAQAAEATIDETLRHPEIATEAEALRTKFIELLPFLAPIAGFQTSTDFYVPGISRKEADCVSAHRDALVKRFNEAYLPWRKRRSLAEEAVRSEERLSRIRVLKEGLDRQYHDVLNLRAREKSDYDQNPKDCNTPALKRLLDEAVADFNRCVEQKQRCAFVTVQPGSATSSNGEMELAHYMVLNPDQRAALLKQIVVNQQGLFSLRTAQLGVALQDWNQMMEQGNRLAALLDELTDVVKTGGFSRVSACYGTRAAWLAGCCTQYTTLWNS